MIYTSYSYLVFDGETSKSKYLSFSWYMLSHETKAIGVFLLLYVVLHISLYSILPWLDTYSFTYSPVIHLIIFFVLQEVVLLALLWWSWIRVTKEKGALLWYHIVSRRQWKWWNYVMKYVLGWLLCYFLGNAVFLGILTVLERDIPGLYGDQMVITFLQWLPMDQWWEYVLIFFLVAIVWPIVEEVIFRGVITHVFMKQRAYAWVVLAALLFALIHGERLVVRNLLILSLFLWHIYRKTWSLWYSFLFHFGINGIAISVLILSQLYPTLLVK